MHVLPAASVHVSLRFCSMCSVGGLKKGLVVELANGSNAMVLDVTGDTNLSSDARTGACNYNRGNIQSVHICLRPPTFV